VHLPVSQLTSSLAINWKYFLSQTVFKL